MKNSLLLMQKSKGIEHYLKIGVELKLFKRKLDFWRFIWKLESRKLFEDWSLEKLNLRIGILDIKFEINQTFGNRKLSSEIGIWKNCLKWNFKINN